MEFRLPIPKNWQDFEVICQKLWRDIWSDPNTQRNGRQGQPQAGVDVFGRPTYLGVGYAGVQCKDRDGRLGSKLHVEEIDSECLKATTFHPNIEEFTIATTSERDEKNQERARERTSSGAFPFAVSVWSWDDIEEEIRCRPVLLDAYYNGVVIAPADATRVSISFLSQKQQCNAFFSRPEIERRIPPALKMYLLPLVYELSDNAFRHGKASQCSVLCEDSAIHFEDNGVPFNPLEGLDPTKATLRSHVGSRVLDLFIRKLGSSVSPDYELVAGTSTTLNRLTLHLAEPTWVLPIPAGSHISIDIGLVSDRKTAAAVAASLQLPADQKEIILMVEGMCSVSSMVEFIDAVLHRMHPTARLVAYVPLPIEYLSLLRESYPLERLLLIPR